jgi:hypothetical protein
MQPLNIAETIAALSGPRLGSYRTFFHPADDYELYGIYCWNEEISSCLTALLNNLEVTMRNAFHRELSLRYGSAPGTASSDWYNAIRIGGRSLEKVQAITHRRSGRSFVPIVPPPAPDDVMAKLTLGFWKHLLDVDKDRRGGMVSWGTILPGLLPKHPNSNVPYWSRQQRQDELFARIDLAGGLRNRIAHLEPVWKTGPLLEERRARRGSYTPRVVKAAPVTPDEAIDRLKLVHNRVLELLYWFSPHRSNDYERSAARSRFRHLASADGLNAFRR